MRYRTVVSRLLAGLTGSALLFCLTALAPAARPADANDPITANSARMLDEGRDTFRYETFGDQVFWSRVLGLDQAIRQVSPRAALGVGLKVDSEALSPATLAALRHGAVNLDDPAVTRDLLKS